MKNMLLSMAFHFIDRQEKSMMMTNFTIRSCHLLPAINEMSYAVTYSTILEFILITVLKQMTVTERSCRQQDCLCLYPLIHAEAVQFRLRLDLKGI